MGTITMQLTIILAGIFLISVTSVLCQYEPNWESLDSRPLPQWYDDAKLGIFITWGLYSVPSYGTEWFWYKWVTGEKMYVDFMNKNYKPGFTYPDFASQFTAEFFDPDFWADLLQDSGAKYVVLISKHVEGFTLWPSKFSSNWNAKAVGANRDLLGELAKSVRARTDLHFGLYHCLYEWFHPLYLLDKANNFTTSYYPKVKPLPELYELVKTYRPELIWSDGDWEATDSYWTSTEFLTWLYNESPVKDTVVTNDRWGNGTTCLHGGYLTCYDKFNPGVLQNRKWENAMSIDQGSWGFRRNAVLSDYLTMDDLTKLLAETVSCGGNLLMNIGPTHDGRIVPIFEERLRQMGSWMKVNGEAIYSTKPWAYQNDTFAKDVWYTSKWTESGESIYAIVLEWPRANILNLGSPKTGKATIVSMLGYQKPVQWEQFDTHVQVTFPSLTPEEMPCLWAWVIKFQNLVN